jgi:guanidinoacetate N-methyltransferase
MTRKLRRSPDFDITLEVKNDAFIAPPRPAQRNWLLNRAVAELAQDLTELDGLAKRFVPGLDAVQIADRSQAELADDEIMEDWQIPLMKAMAEVVTETRGDILEIGFGRGVSASFIQECGARSHTIVECNPAVIERFAAWRAGYPGREIHLLAGKWQEVTGQMGQYDGIFFHTFPLDEQEYLEQAVNSVTFAAHFFPTAAAHLRPGGAFTYMTNEIDSFSRAHQRLLFQYFRSFTLSLLAPLAVPADARDTWWADAMVIVKALK